MLALYKMLVRDSSQYDEEVQHFLKLTYSLSYMDNCAITSNEASKLPFIYNKLTKVFSDYCFPLQQFISNSQELQNYINKDLKLE